MTSPALCQYPPDRPLPTNLKVFVFPPGLLRGRDVKKPVGNQSVFPDQINRLIHDPSNRERKLTKPLQTEGLGMELPPNRLYRGCWGNRPGSCVRHTAFRNPRLNPKDCPSLRVAKRD
jgi:hypothetical protein